MKVDVVNQKDQIVGSKDSQLLKQGDIYRVSALWLTNLQGDILLARRSAKKMHDPGKWGPAASGIVVEGESYYDSIVRLAQEEIGLCDLQFSELPEIRRSHKYNYFCQWYKAVINKKGVKLIINDKFEEIKWFSRQELLDNLEKHPHEYLTALGLYLELFK